MPNVSANNLDLTARVQAVRERYQAFNLALRGATSDLLTGLMNGTTSLLRLSAAYDNLVRNLTSELRHQTLNDLFVLSQSAQQSAASVTLAHPDDRTLAISETLQGGFRESLESVIEAQALRDAQIAEQFVRKQLYQGRTVATTAELSVDLQFRHTDRGGRAIDSIDYVGREVNWAYRQHFNTVLTYMLLSAEVDQAQVDGGSKAGNVIELSNYDKASPMYFHHNSKALLQPMKKDERPDI